MNRKDQQESKLEGYGFVREEYYDAHQFIRAITFDPSGSCLCIGSGKGRIEIFDSLDEEVDKEQTLFPKFVGHEYHKGSILDIKYSPDGSCIASASNDKTIRLIDMRELSCKYRAAYYHKIEIKPEHTLENEHSVKCLHFPSCLQLLSGESGECTLKLWDITKQALVSSWSEHIGSITAIQSDDNMIVSSGTDKKIAVWDLHQTAPIKVIGRYPSKVNDIKLIKHPSDYYVIAAYEDSAVICYSLARGDIVWQSVIHQTECNAVSVSTDDQLCVSSSLNGQFAITNCQNGQLLSSLYQHHGAVTVEWNPKQATFASVTHKGLVNLWHCTI